MSKHFFALFIFFAVVTSGCDQFCQDNPGVEFCLVLAESGTEEATEDEEVEEGGDEEIFVCPHREQQAWVGACVACEELDPQPGDFGQCVIVDGQAEIWHDADIDGIPDGLDNCPDDANPGQVDTDSDDQGDLCESSLFVSLSANQPGNLHNGNQDLISFQIYTEEEEVGILSLEFSIFSEGASFFQEEVELFWVIDSSNEEELDSVDLQTIMEDDLSETAGSRYRAQASPEFGMAANTQHGFSLRGGMREVQSFSIVVSCLTSVRYRSRRTGVEESLALGVEVCNTLRN